MSISAALYTAVSALRAQSSALSNISNNLANSQTTGYKASTTSFSSLLSGDTSVSSGGVTASVKTSMTTQGTILTTNNDTDLAINGSGFFVVSSAETGGNICYTRDGSFEVDSDGNLVSDGYYLQGWATDDDGNIIGSASSSNLTSINIKDLTSSVAATENIEITGNVPAEAEIDDTFSTTTEVFDSLGKSTTLTLSWEKTAENTWSVTFSTSDSNASVTSSAITVKFNEDGTLASPETASLTISGWSSGAADSTIALDLGTANSAAGLSQYESGEDDAILDLSITQDGLEYGNLSGISINDDGSVVASFDNGEDRTIYKIALANFKNPDGLVNVSGTIFSSSLDSGACTYSIPGTSGSGTLTSGALESSTTDTSEEFSDMMQAQQAYSASAQVMSTANEMFQTLMNSVK